jgi:hypothetical protein
VTDKGIGKGISRKRNAKSAGTNFREGANILVQNA